MFENGKVEKREEKIETSINCCFERKEELPRSAFISKRYSFILQKRVFIVSYISFFPLKWLDGFLSGEERDLNLSFLFA